MVNTERLSRNSNPAVVGARTSIDSSKLTRSYKHVVSSIPTVYQNSTGSRGVYRAGPISFSESECDCYSHDKRSTASIEADCVIISGVSRKKDRINATLKILENQGGLGPLKHVDFSLGSFHPTKLLSLPLYSKQSFYLQPQQESRKISALGYIQLGASKGSITLQYVQKWVHSEAAITVAHGILAGSGWSSVADFYAAFLTKLSDCIGSDFQDSVAVLISKRFVPQDCRWIKTAAGRESVPIPGSLESREEFSFSVVLRDNTRYEKLCSIVLKHVGGITIFRLGPHVVAWAASLERAQEFAKRSRMSEVSIQHIKMEAGDFSGTDVREELEHWELRLSGLHGRPAFLRYIEYKYEILKINRRGLLESFFGSTIKIVPYDLSPLGEAHVLLKLSLIAPPPTGTRLTVSGTPVLKILSRLRGPCWKTAPTAACEPLSWEEFALMVIKPESLGPNTTMPYTSFSSKEQKSRPIAIQPQHIEKSSSPTQPVLEAAKASSQPALKGQASLLLSSASDEEALSGKITSAQPMPANRQATVRVEPTKIYSQPPGDRKAQAATTELRRHKSSPQIEKSPLLTAPAKPAVVLNIVEALVAEHCPITGSTNTSASAPIVKPVNNLQSSSFTLVTTKTSSHLMLRKSPLLLLPASPDESLASKVASANPKPPLEATKLGKSNLSLGSSVNRWYSSPFVRVGG